LLSGILRRRGRRFRRALRYVPDVLEGSLQPVLPLLDHPITGIAQELVLYVRGRRRQSDRYSRQQRYRPHSEGVLVERRLQAGARLLRRLLRLYSQVLR
jgi:hypothetical protein